MMFRSPKHYVYLSIVIVAVGNGVLFLSPTLRDRVQQLLRIEEQTPSPTPTGKPSADLSDYSFPSELGESSPTPMDTPDGARPLPQAVRGSADSSQADPVVSCTISQQCGGGTKSLRLSECQAAVCCQVGSVWSLTASQADCSRLQGRTSGVASTIPTVECTTSYGTFRLSPGACQQAKALDTQQGTGNGHKILEDYLRKSQQDMAALDRLLQDRSAIDAAQRTFQPPTPTVSSCPVDWNEYFKRCPGYYPVQGVGGTPPCYCMGNTRTME